uniref:Ig-like domain-containing protein n=1 Tax=Chrysemys picta bellii TaxID=8478 RepID=A0A8C3FFR7_CHRPI
VAAGGGDVNFSKTAIFPFPLPHPQTVRVSAVEEKTPEELFVENGTEARLPCPFSSSEVISSATSVSWSFQPEGAMTPIPFFYYSQGNAYPGKDTPFKNRISWAGDLNKKDASVSIANVQFRDNGTYFCDVKNPPDIVFIPIEIRLRVVQRGDRGGRSYWAVCLWLKRNPSLQLAKRRAGGSIGAEVFAFG